MNLKDILKQYGVEERVSEIESAITSQLHTEYVPKTQYNKKVNALDKLQEKVDDLEARQSKDEYKTKFEDLEKEFNDYKQNIELEKTNSSKTNALVGALKETGFDESIIDLLKKDFDLSKIEVEDNKIKGWEEIVKPYTEKYKGFINTQTIEGNQGAKPISNPVETFTREQINSMSSSEINANWDKVSKSLANLK